MSLLDSRRVSLFTSACSDVNKAVTGYSSPPHPLYIFCENRPRSVNRPARRGSLCSRGHSSEESGLIMDRVRIFVLLLDI